MGEMGRSERKQNLLRTQLGSPLEIVSAWQTHFVRRLAPHLASHLAPRLAPHTGARRITHRLTPPPSRNVPPEARRVVRSLELSREVAHVEMEEHVVGDIGLADEGAPLGARSHLLIELLGRFGTPSVCLRGGHPPRGETPPPPFPRRRPS